MLAPVVAIIGCDGSGKSTLSAGLLRTIATDYAVASCYLGLGSGAIGTRIRALPLLGAAVERRLVRKAAKTRSTDGRIPGLATAIVVYWFSLLRLRRFRRVLALREAGVLVLTDRYPQIEVAGFYDGPGLSAARASSRAVAWLAARERRQYEWMASFRPTLVIRLNVDLATAMARKPDHDPALLARKIAITPQLRFDGAPITDLDARASYAQVLSAAREIIRHAVG